MCSMRDAKRGVQVTSTVVNAQSKFNHHGWGGPIELPF